MNDGVNTTKIRSGIIGNELVNFKVKVNVNNGHIKSAEGELICSEKFYESVSGTHQGLKDTKTNLDFGIFISNERFSFERFENIKELFK